MSQQTQTTSVALPFTTDQWITALEKTLREVAELEARQKQLGFVPLHLIRAQLQDAQTKLSHLSSAQGVTVEALETAKTNVENLKRHDEVQTGLDELRKRVKKLRVGALQSIRQADVGALTRAIGVMAAYPIFLKLGVGTLPALISCTRNQFALWARPATLGWGGTAVPERIDEEIVKQVESVLASIGLRWREGSEKPKVRLPEGVLGGQFPPSSERDPADSPEQDQKKNPKRRRFADADFLDYAHPSIALGVSGRTPPLKKALEALGIYCWEDLELRTAADLKSRLDERQFSTVQWEVRRRGMLFQREEKPAIVFMDAIDADRINPDSIREETVVSQEDRVKVRDKDGKLVGIIDSKDEYQDRVGAEDDLQASSSEGPLGIVEGYEEHAVEEEVAVEEQDEQIQAQTQSPGIALQVQPPRNNQAVGQGPATGQAAGVASAVTSDTDSKSEADKQE